MRILFCLVGLWMSGITQGQTIEAPELDEVSVERRDPTAPSPEILERLSAGAPPANTEPSHTAVDLPAESALPELKIKGLVFSDARHGTVLVEAGGQRQTVGLNRDQPLPAFTLQGIEFQVIDFTQRSLVLRAGNRRLLLP